MSKFRTAGIIARNNGRVEIRDCRISGFDAAIIASDNDEVVLDENECRNEEPRRKSLSGKGRLLESASHLAGIGSFLTGILKG